MDAKRAESLRDFYKDRLLNDILAFWLKHARDREYGGYHTCLNRDGSVYDYDKLCMWSAGRIIWTYSYLYNEFERDPEWLAMARWGVDFLQEHGFAPDGSLYYSLTRDGRPLEPEQDVFNDLSTVVGFSEFARATSDETLYRQAKDIFLRVWARLQAPGKAFQGVDPGTRPVRLHGHSMITLGVLQELRRFRSEPEYEPMIDQCLDHIVSRHMKPDKRALFELVAWNGDVLPGSRGRWICPGHMIECGAFIIHEARHRQDDRLLRTGVDLIDWGYAWGRDREHGGIINDVDCEGLPSPTNDIFKHNSKMWWSHAEALYGLLLAYSVTGEERFLKAHDETRDYAFEHFADSEFGEWFACLDLRGNRISEAKGSFRKNCFHIARNFYWCWRLLDSMAGAQPVTPAVP